MSKEERDAIDQMTETVELLITGLGRLTEVVEKTAKRLDRLETRLRESEDMQLEEIKALKLLTDTAQSTVKRLDKLEQRNGN